MSADASPCIQLCVLDAVTQHCIGCGRSSAEIADWIMMSKAQRIAVRAELAGRLQAMTSRRVRKGGSDARRTSR